MMKTKIIYALTMLLPMSAYLIIYSLLFSITPDLIIDDEIADLSVITYEDEYFIYGDIETQYIGGYVLYNEGVIGAVIDNDDIIKIGSGYYSYTQDEEGVLRLVDIKDIERQEQQGSKLPISFVISAFATGIVIMIIIGKFDGIKKQPYIAVLVSLWTVTGFLWLVSLIANNMLGVFVVASISWTMVIFEKLYHDGKLSQTDKNKADSETLKELTEAMKQLGVK